MMSTEADLLAEASTIHELTVVEVHQMVRAAAELGITRPGSRAVIKAVHAMFPGLRISENVARTAVLEIKAELAGRIERGEHPPIPRVVLDTAGEETVASYQQILSGPQTNLIDSLQEVINFGHESLRRGKGQGFRDRVMEDGFAATESAYVRPVLITAHNFFFSPMQQ